MAELKYHTLWQPAIEGSDGTVEKKRVRRSQSSRIYGTQSHICLTMASNRNSLATTRPRVIRRETSDMFETLRDTYSHSQPIVLATRRLVSESQSRVSRVLMAPLEACGALCIHVHPGKAGIADPRILSWWTDTDLRTDSPHRSDAPLGLTWSC